MNQLPETLAGYQHVPEDTIQDGDICVLQGKVYGYAWSADFGTKVGDFEAMYPGYHIYRKIPVAHHCDDKECLKPAVDSCGHELPGSTSKPSNPKDIVGSDKIPFHLWPETATALGSLALLDGALKYGRANWRVIGVRSSIYYDAARRHLNKWFEGENTDPDSGLPHLAHAMACLAILIDAGAAGKLNDDRQVKGGYPEFLESLTHHVKRLKEKYKDKNPIHYNISSNVP